MAETQSYEVLSMNRIRRATAKRMLGSVTDKPHVTLNAESNAHTLISTRDIWAPQVESEGKVRLTLTSLLIKLTSLSLREHPRINGRVEHEEIRLYDAINAGVAVALDEGLVVPVIKNADEKPLYRIAQELHHTTEQARSGRLSPNAMMDGTFSISNLGAFGVKQFTPIINSPEIAILGVGGIFPEVRVEEGSLVEVPKISLSLSFDHAAIEGAQAARFLKGVVDNIEQADVLLLGNLEGNDDKHR